MHTAGGGRKKRWEKRFALRRFDGWIGRWGIKANPAVPHAGSAVLMGATFMIQPCFCDAAFHTVAMLKDVFKTLVSSSFQSRK